MTDVVDPLLRTRVKPGPERGRVYGGEDPGERAARRRARLMAAGIELFGNQGYAATRVDRLCGLAQVSTRHFYEIYPSKEAAFLDVFDHLITDAYSGILDSLGTTRDHPVSERVTLAFEAYLTPLFADPRAARITFVEIVGLSPEAEQRRSEYREALIATVEAEFAAAAAQGEDVPGDVRFAVLALVGAVTVTVHDWILRRDARTPQHMHDELYALATFLLGR